MCALRSEDKERVCERVPQQADVHIGDYTKQKPSCIFLVYSIVLTTDITVNKLKEKVCGIYFGLEFGFLQ